MSTISLKDLAAQQSSQDSPFGSGPRNVALRATSFDVPNRVTTGVDLRTGETLSIRLSEALASDARDDVPVWAATRFRERNGVSTVINPKAVVPGEGIIIFESVRKVADGQPLEARWGATASHNLGVADVVTALVRPATVPKHPTLLDPKRAIEVIDPNTAKRVMSMAELRETMTDIMSQPFHNAVVRAHDPSGTIMVHSAYKPQNNTVASGIDWFLNNTSLGKLLSDEVCQGAVVEVMALHRLYPGMKYRQTLTDDSKIDAKILSRDWSLGDAGFGFTSAIVAMRRYIDEQGNEGGLQYTKLRPEFAFPMLYKGLEDLPSPFIQPGVPPVPSAGAKKNEQAAPAQPSAAPDSPSESGDGDAAPPANAFDPDDAMSQKLASAARAFAH